MKENRVIVEINKPASEVFEYTTNPHNTHLWLASIKFEEANLPITVGTSYRNTSDGITWDSYTVTAYQQDALFEIQNEVYGVRYTYTPLEGATALEYYEWMKEGELSNPLSHEVLANLKKILEAK